MIARAFLVAGYLLLYLAGSAPDAEAQDWDYYLEKGASAELYKVARNGETVILTRDGRPPIAITHHCSASTCFARIVSVVSGVSGIPVEIVNRFNLAGGPAAGGYAVLHPQKGEAYFLANVAAPEQLPAPAWGATVRAYDAHRAAFLNALAQVARRGGK